MPELEDEEQEADSVTYQDSHKRTMERIRAMWPEKIKTEDAHKIEGATSLGNTVSFYELVDRIH